MYIIAPLQITPISGVLHASSVDYPDTGTVELVDEAGTVLGSHPAAYARWVFGKAYAMGAHVSYHGAVYVASSFAVPAWSGPPERVIDLLKFLPPGHPYGGFPLPDDWTGPNPELLGPSPVAWPVWSRLDYPFDFSPAEEYGQGRIVVFPAVSHSASFAAIEALAGAAQGDMMGYLADLPEVIPGGVATWEAFVRGLGDPAFTPAYPAGLWARNAVPDDGESLLPKYPSLASKYWDAVEPVMFAQHPELPVGELATYGGRVWRKRTVVAAAYEAPPSAPNDWALVRASNRYAMFDASVQSQTKQTAGNRGYEPILALNETISVVLTPGARIVDALALLNLNATTVRVQVQAGTPVQSVYDKTVNVVGIAAVTNWYEWFFAPRHVSQSLILDDLPPVPGSTITITITNAGGQAACGVCIVGKQTYIGNAQYGASVGIKDYSLKTTDDFGNITPTQRAYSDRLTVSLVLHNDLVDPVKRLLTTYRTTPLLWVGHPSLPSTIVYGYYRDFSAVIAYPKESTCNLEIEGLT